jgi:hypothetical protein
MASAPPGTLPGALKAPGVRLAIFTCMWNLLDDASAAACHGNGCQSYEVQNEGRQAAMLHLDDSAWWRAEAC